MIPGLVFTSLLNLRGVITTCKSPSHKHVRHSHNTAHSTNVDRRQEMTPNRVDGLSPAVRPDWPLDVSKNLMAGNDALKTERLHRYLAKRKGSHEPSAPLVG